MRDLVLLWCLGVDAASPTSQHKLQMIQGWFCLYFACADLEFPPPVLPEPLGSKIKMVSFARCSWYKQLSGPTMHSHSPPFEETALPLFQPIRYYLRLPIPGPPTPDGRACDISWPRSSYQPGHGDLVEGRVCDPDWANQSSSQKFYDLEKWLLLSFTRKWMPMKTAWES